MSATLRKIDFATATPSQPPQQPPFANYNATNSQHAGLPKSPPQFPEEDDYSSQPYWAKGLIANSYLKLNTKSIPQHTPSPRTVGGFDYYGFDGKGGSLGRSPHSNRGKRNIRLYRQRTSSSNTTVTEALEKFSVKTDVAGQPNSRNKDNKKEDANRPKHLHPNEVRKLRGDMLISEMETFASLLSDDYLESKNNSRPQSSGTSSQIPFVSQTQNSNKIEMGNLSRVLQKHQALSDSGFSSARMPPGHVSRPPHPKMNSPRRGNNNNVLAGNNVRPQTAAIVNHVQDVQKRIDDALADLVGSDDDEAEGVRGPSLSKSNSPTKRKNEVVSSNIEDKQSRGAGNTVKGLSARMRNRNTLSKEVELGVEEAKFLFDSQPEQTSKVANFVRQQHLKSDHGHLNFIPTSPRGLAARPAPPAPLSGYRLPSVAPSSYAFISSSPRHHGPAPFLTSRASGQLLQTASATLHQVGDMPRMGKSNNPTLNALKDAFLNPHSARSTQSARLTGATSSSQYGLVETPLVINHFRVNEGTLGSLDVDMDGNSKRISTRKYHQGNESARSATQQRVAEKTKKAQEALLGPFGLLPKDTPQNPTYGSPQHQPHRYISPIVQPLFGSGGSSRDTLNSSDPTASMQQQGSLLAHALRKSHDHMIVPQAAQHNTTERYSSSPPQLSLVPQTTNVVGGNGAVPPFHRRSLLGEAILSKPVAGSPAALALIANLTLAVNEEQGRDIKSSDELVPLDPSVEAAILGTLPPPPDASEAAEINPDWVDAAAVMRAVVQSTAILPDHSAAMRLRAEHENAVLEALRVQRAANGQIWSTREAPTAMAQVSVASNVLASGEKRV